jgi:hypothetical protein
MEVPASGTDPRSTVSAHDSPRRGHSTCLSAHTSVTFPQHGAGPIEMWCPNWPAIPRIKHRNRDDQMRIFAVHGTCDGEVHIMYLLYRVKLERLAAIGHGSLRSPETELVTS